MDPLKRLQGSRRPIQAHGSSCRDEHRFLRILDPGRSAPIEKGQSEHEGSASDKDAETGEDLILRWRGYGLFFLEGTVQCGGWLDC